jgi:hypothetical protein
MIGLLIAAAVLVLDAAAIIDAFNSGKSAGNRVLWIALIVCLPLAGPLCYYLLARRGPLDGGRRAITRSN